MTVGSARPPSATPRAPDAEAVFAMPVHNPGAYVVEALETLLAQKGRRLAVVALDDASTDNSLALLESFAEQDERLVVYRNERRLGIPRAWNRVMALALEEAPAARYAAWAGDHDRWANGWLGRLADALDACAGAALAVPLTRKIAVDGTIVRNSDRRLDTRANTSPTALVRATVRDMTAGDQIYGLFRRRALEHALPVPHVVLFDRLVLASIALEGPIVQVDDHLWERRTFARPIATVLDREREAFWPEGAPLWARLPPLVPGSAVLGWRALRGRLGPGMPRRVALRAAMLYCVETRRRERKVKARRRRRDKRLHADQRRLDAPAR